MTALLVLLFALAVVGGPAEGEGTATAVAPAADRRPLAYEDVVLAAVARHPEVRAAVETRGAAEAKLLSARGVFDPVLAAKASLYPVGGYRSYAVGTELRQYTPVWGITGYVGYRIGLGDFPVYRMEDQTLDRGEVRAGLRIPVVRDGPIDDRRAALRRAELALERAECEVRSQVLATARDATYAYWRWVVAEAKRRVAVEILTMARKRQAQIERGVALGARADIEAVDNSQFVADRRARLADAERRLRNAAAELRYVLAGSDLRVPDRPGPPPWLDGPPPPPPPADIEADLARALAARPDVCTYLRDRDLARVDLRLARNRLAPKLYADLGVSDDFGAGDPKLDPTELAVGVYFEMPLLLRKARGERRAAERKLAAAEAKLAAVAAKVRADLEKRHSDAVGGYERMVEQARRRRAARRVMEAERSRFERGASDLVVVNLRELAYADATLAYLDAILAYRLATAEYDLARGDLPDGLGDATPRRR